MVGHVFQPGGVAINGEAFVGVVEVAVIEVVAHRQSGDIAGGQFAGVGLPLFGGVVPDEGLVKGPANEGDGFFFQVGGVVTVDFGGLFADELPGLVGRIVAAEELVDEAEPHGELVGTAVVHGKYAVLVAGE